MWWSRSWSSFAGLVVVKSATKAIQKGDVFLYPIFDDDGDSKRDHSMAARVAGVLLHCQTVGYEAISGAAILDYREFNAAIKWTFGDPTLTFGYFRASRHEDSIMIRFDNMPAAMTLSNLEGLMRIHSSPPPPPRPPLRPFASSSSSSSSSPSTLIWCTKADESIMNSLYGLASRLRGFATEPPVSDHDDPRYLFTHAAPFLQFKPT
jgi:hypothetical protein